MPDFSEQLNFEELELRHDSNQPQQSFALSFSNVKISQIHSHETGAKTLSHLSMAREFPQFPSKGCSALNHPLFIASSP